MSEASSKMSFGLTSDVCSQANELKKSLAAASGCQQVPCSNGDFCLSTDSAPIYSHNIAEACSMQNACHPSAASLRPLLASTPARTVQLRCLS